jgi:hypothetical protein
MQEIHLHIKRIYLSLYSVLRHLSVSIWAPAVVMTLSMDDNTGNVRIT